MPRRHGQGIRDRSDAGEYFYFDMRQTPHEDGHDWAAVFDAKKVFGFDFTDKGFSPEQMRNVVGLQAAFFSEAYVSHEPEKPDYLDYMCFPRICALARIAWRGNGEGWDAYYKGLVEKHYDRMAAMGIRFRLFPPKVSYKDGAFTVTADDEYPEVLIKGCRMRGNRARGLLLGSRNRMVIEDNYFHIAGAAILIEGDANYWYEQSGVRDVVIRRNLFENGNYGSPGWGSACIAVGSGIPDRETSRYHRNIRVEGNTFRVFDPRIVNLYCVDGFVFTQDNVIEYTDDYPVLSGEKRNFITRNCDNIVIEKEQTDK